MSFICFVYLFTICNTCVARNKRLDVLRDEKNIWEVAIFNYNSNYRDIIAK